jgi:hypothetical protein
MAKKKQFAGKKTKLARLPLTQALARQTEGGATFSPAPAPALSLFTQLPLTWEEVGAGRGGPLAAAFLSLVGELAELKSELQATLGPAAVSHRIYLPDQVPPPARIRHALRQAQQSLRDLQRRLSPL